jgi:TnpA family transposase
LAGTASARRVPVDGKSDDVAAPPRTDARATTRRATLGADDAKTLHILRLADGPGYRRQIKSRANLQEGRHALARKIFRGRSGQLY